MKVLTVLLFLGPLAGFAWMWSKCFLVGMEADRLREENSRLRQQVEYTTRINHHFIESNSRATQAQLYKQESLGPLFESRQETASAQAQ